jgi:hypothetical protein
MLLALTPHPDTPCDAVTRIEVEVFRPRPLGLALSYVVTGDVDRLRLPAFPAGMVPSRADDLWRTTCFEAFVRAGAGYYEFNLASSGQWAAYGFDGYRSGMASAAGAEIYTLEVSTRDRSFELSVELDLDGLPGLPANASWRLGLSAVIEETSGARSYWALAHAPGKPDFHHPDAFAFDLESA